MRIWLRTDSVWARLRTVADLLLLIWLAFRTPRRPPQKTVLALCGGYGSERTLCGPGCGVASAYLGGLSAAAASPPKIVLALGGGYGSARTLFEHGCGPASAICVAFRLLRRPLEKTVLALCGGYGAAQSLLRPAADLLLLTWPASQCE